MVRRFVSVDRRYQVSADPLPCSSFPLSRRQSSAVIRPFGYVQLGNRLRHPLSCKRVSAGQAACTEDPQARPPPPSSVAHVPRAMGTMACQKGRSFLALHGLQAILRQRRIASTPRKLQALRHRQTGSCHWCVVHNSACQQEGTGTTDIDHQLMA